MSKAIRRPGPDTLPEHLEEQRTYVTCGQHVNQNVNTHTSALMYMALGLDNSWSHKHFTKHFKINIIYCQTEMGVECAPADSSKLQFDLIGVDPSIGNALRRIMMADVPTMAIEHVYIEANNGIIQDDVLSHRLGLLPISADPDKFEYRLEGDEGDENNTIVFKLDVKCYRDEKNKLRGDKVYSGNLEWLPDGSQYSDLSKTKFKQNQFQKLGYKLKPTQDDILLAQLGNQHEICLECHCTKGVGSDHAKFSPVAGCWYRPFPLVKLFNDRPNDQITKETLDSLVLECPDIFSWSIDEDNQEYVQVISDCRNAVSLEKVRALSEDPDRPEFHKQIKVLKIKEHLIYNIETVGHFSPDQVFVQACDILIGKCDALLNNLYKK